MKYFLLTLLTFSLYAQDAFIDTSKLHSKLKNSTLVLIDTTDATTFAKGHIPRATQVDIEKFRFWVDKTYLLMRSPTEIQEAASSLGINQNSEVILYGHNKGKEYLKASYIALALIVNGFTNVSILNGGYGDWEYEYDISHKNITPKKGDFKAHFNPNVIVDLAYVKAHLGKISMIEARPRAFYTGARKSKGVRRLGHIKGALSSYWHDKFNTDNTLKSNQELNKIFLTDNKLNPDKEVIAYCTGGLEASMNWYILTQHLHYKDVKLYDASMKQWGNRDDTPMEK